MPPSQNVSYLLRALARTGLVEGTYQENESPKLIDGARMGRGEERRWKQNGETSSTKTWPRRGPADRVTIRQEKAEEKSNFVA
jgi:hypothetical protein